jgi:hypothetical protein
MFKYNIGALYYTRVQNLVRQSFKCAGGEKYGKIPRSVNDGDDLNRLRFPGVRDNVGVEIPEPIAPRQKLFVIMPDSGRLSEPSERLIEFFSQPFSGVGAVLCDIEENLSKVFSSLWSENEPPFQ